MLGPLAPILIVLLFLPLLASSALATATLQELTVLLAVCRPELEVLVAVEKSSEQLRRDVEELRQVFRRMVYEAQEELEADFRSESFRSHDTDASSSLEQQRLKALCESHFNERSNAANVLTVKELMGYDNERGYSHPSHTFSHLPPCVW